MKCIVYSCGWNVLEECKNPKEVIIDELGCKSQFTSNDNMIEKIEIYLSKHHNYIELVDVDSYCNNCDFLTGKG